MIPIQLTMEAFGPFLEKQTVDFSALCRDHLFMISGPTGSGKTTVFDAMIFALYGEPSGELRSPDQFKSDFADEKAECSVTFRFWSGGSEYTVIRKPKQPYINRYGAPASHPESVRLILPDGTELSKKSDVEEAIFSVLRLTRDQFRKIVMLPQGEFREMLNADSAEKQKIFRHLFSTGLYETFTNRLKAETNALEQSYRENEIACYSKLQTIPEYADATDQSLIDYDAVLSEIREKANAVKQEYDRVLALRKTASGKADAINLDLMQEHNRKLDRLEQSVNTLHELERKRPEIDSGKELLSRLTRTRNIKPVYDRLEEQKRIAETELEKSRELRSSKELAEKSCLTSEEQLKGSVLKLEKIPEIDRKIVQYRQQIDAISEYEEAVSKRDRENREAETIRLLINGLNLRQEELDAAEEIERLSEKKQALGHLFRAVDNARKAEDSFNETERRFRNGFSLFLASQASFLAKELKSGEPCPVCGSVDHPSPAVKDGSGISSEEFDRLREIYDRSREETQKAVQLVSDLFPLCRELFPEGFTSESLRSEADDHHLNAARKDLEDSILLLKEKTAEIRSGIEGSGTGAVGRYDRETVRTELEKAQSSLSGALTKIRLLEESCESLRGKLVPDETRESLSEKIRGCEREAESIKTDHENRTIELERAKLRLKHLEENLTDNARRIDDSEKRLRQLSENWADALGDDPGYTEEQFLELIPRLGEIDGLEHVILDHEKQILQCESSIRTLEEELDDRSRYPLEEMKGKKDELLKEADRLERSVRELHGQYASLSGVADQLGTLIRDRKSLADRYRDVNDLYQIARGNNPKRIDLERYVLSSYFDDVIDRANLRLGRMTNDRYAMVRRTEREKGNKSSGLEIDVFDAYTGKSRHVNTLSGGESFQCALCLALGLSDTISENAGGVRIDALFIDEGFGSLDTQSLDTAVNCILSLKESGRIVGIISHVESLKERIPVRLEVLPGKSGSSVRITGVD